MRKFLLLSLAAILALSFLQAGLCAAAGASSPAGNATETLKTLQKRFDALNADANRALLRENWLRLIEDCTELAAKSAGGVQGRAAFLAARGREEMSNRSHNGKDRRQAIEAYAAVAAKYPQSDLAPQSLYRQAHLLGLTLGRTEEAAAVLTALRRKYPKSQAAREAGTLQASLAAGAKTPAPSRQKPAPAAESPRRKPAPAENPRGARSGKNPDAVMEQLGLTVRTIMLDPGHGGRDPGCMANTLVEKDFTLRMAKLIGSLLEKKGFVVLYSRSGDQFISLPDRPDLANKKNADLFISLHLNANPSASVRGLETYYLSEARTGDAAKVAARENGVSLQNISDLQVILTDLMLSAKMEESHALALCIQQAVLNNLRKADLSVRNGGVRSAPFYVLMGARMPAILVEFGYATNTQEAANLLSEKFLQSQAEGLVNGILAYKEQLAKSVR
jgi:N-acetylmuramoyl-L-alanine amidase